MKMLRLFSSAAALATIAACSDSPTVPGVTGENASPAATLIQKDSTMYQTQSECGGHPTTGGTKECPPPPQ